jgi:hypothetical protein
MHPKLRFSILCLSALLALATPNLLAQTTINVGPGQTNTTIQSAINAASTGDTILVAPGTYYENIDFLGKAITVTSSGGAAKTIINGGNKGGMATVVFRSNEQSNSVLSNFTITGGGDTLFAGTSDGGIYVAGGDPFVDVTSPTIENNIITANYCHNIDIAAAAPTIRNNEVSGLLQDSQGSQGESYCTFGSAIYIGGDAYAGVTGTTIIGNTIENNLTGSAISLWAPQNTLILNNIIRNNTSPDPGSALTEANSSNTVFAQNLIYGNTSNCGGAIAFMEPSILIANNTIVDNVTPRSNGGSECTPISQIYPAPYSYGMSSPGALIINNIISGSTSYPAVNCDWLAPPSEANQPTFQHNILHNAGGPFFGSYCIDVSGADGNITADPQFVSPSTGNYHLKSSSPAIDAGDNSVLQTYLAMIQLPFSTDFDGKPRVQNTLGLGCIIDMGAYEYPGSRTICSTTETLKSSANPSTFGQTVTFTAQLSAPTGSPTGAVQFADGATVLGTETISSTGVSTFTTSLLTVGSHTITATYQPTGSFPAENASLVQVVTGDATATTLTCDPSTITLGGTSILSAAVTSASGKPTGSISLEDNGSLLTALGLTNGAATFTYTGQTIASHTLLATYTPTGDFATSSAACTVTVNGLPTTTTVAVSPNPSTYGQPVVFSTHVAPVAPNKSVPTGMVQFNYCRGASYNVTLDANGDGSYVSPPGVGIADPVGSCSFTGQYLGDSTFAPSVSAPDTYIVTPSPSATNILSASPSPGYLSQPVTFTVQIIGMPSLTGNPVTGLPIPPGVLQFSGTVQLFDGGTQIASALATPTPTNGQTNGVATLSVSTLSLGSHNITAAYVNDPNLGSSTSQAVTEVIIPAPTPDFSLTGSPVTFTNGSSGSASLLLTSLGGFTGKVAITCNPPFPSGYTCTLNASSVSIAPASGASVRYTLQRSTTASLTTPRLGTHDSPRSRILYPALFPITLLSLFGISRKRRALRTLLSLGLLAILASATTACGPDQFININIAGTYPITFTASGSSLPSTTLTTHTLTVNATITP